MHNDQLIELWLQSQKSDQTRENYFIQIGKLTAFLKDKEFSLVELGDLQRFQKHLKSAVTRNGKGYAPKTQQSIIVAIKSFFSFASEEGHIGANPARRVPIIKCQDSRAARVLNREDVDKLIAAPKKRRDILILKTLFFSGARVSEITSLRWQDVQESERLGGQLALFGKGGKNRTVGIKRELFDELMAFKDDVNGKAKEKVFVSQKDDKGMTRQQVFRIVKAAAKAAGVNWGASPHWLRHSYATEALGKGAPLRLIQKDMGHASLQTTQVYLDVNPDESVSDYL